MNINAISSFNNVSNAQAFKAESQKMYNDFYEVIPADVSDDTVVDYGTWGDNYPVPVTAGQRREAQKEYMAKIAAEAAYKNQQLNNEEKPLSVEEMDAQRLRYLVD